MILAPEWIPAWRLKQAYSLTEADILSLVQSLGEQAHISVHPSWGMMEEYFLKPQTEVLPEHWRSNLDGIFDGIGANSPSWIVRTFNERDRLYESLRVVAVHTNDGKFSGAVTSLLGSIYEGEPQGIQVENFCAPFVIPNGDKSSRLFSQVFHESLLFNRYAAVKVLEKANYPLISEVKGITKEFVKTVSLKIQQIEPTNQISVSHPAGSNKDAARILATHQACETVRAEIEQGQHGFQVKGQYKTNKNHFQQAIQAILGDVKPHRDTVREEWGKVREDLKHSGRVPEQ